MEPGLRIRYRRSEAPPPYRYAIALEWKEADDWHTVRLWDNADGVDVHHEHAYTRSGGKQPPILLPFGSPNEAIAAAISRARSKPEEVVEQWRSS